MPIEIVAYKILLAYLISFNEREIERERERWSCIPQGFVMSPSFNAVRRRGGMDSTIEGYTDSTRTYPPAEQAAASGRDGTGPGRL